MSSQPEDTVVVACFGDSITDGTASTLNGDDRWPDVLSRRLHEKYGGARRRSSTPASAATASRHQPATRPRLHWPAARRRSSGSIATSRVCRASSAVIWLEGINDLSGGAKADAVIAGMREIVARSRARGLKIFGATIVSSLGSATAHGTPEVDAERQAINAFIRSAGAFDGVVDFDLATRDPRRPAACARPSSPTARPADPAIDCIRTGPAIRRWDTPSTSRLLAPLFARR